MQGETANPLQKRLAGVVENYQLVGDSAGPGRLENVVLLIPGLVTVRACAACQPATATRTAVVIDDIRIEIGRLR